MNRSQSIFLQDRIFTISNWLTLIRLFLLPLILFFLSQDAPFSNWIALSLMSAAVFTDALDGYFARKFNQVSNLGKIIDPLADKITIGTLVVFLMVFRSFPVWAVGAIIGRDIIILLAGLFLIRWRKVIPTSNTIGKLTGCALALVIIVYTLNWYPLNFFLLWISLGCLFLSSLSYGIFFFKEVRGNSQ